MQRFGRVLKLQPGKGAEYDRQHATVWPDVLAAIDRSGIRNYSLYRYHQWLFAYCELPDGLSQDEVGRVIADDEACARWETLMHELQEPLPESQGAAWWVAMPEVFHLDGATK
jgi:L-rhamnose mutarotase